MINTYIHTYICRTCTEPIGLSSAAWTTTDVVAIRTTLSISISLTISVTITIPVPFSVTIPVPISGPLSHTIVVSISDTVSTVTLQLVGGTTSVKRRRCRWSEGVVIAWFTRSQWFRCGCSCGIAARAVATAGCTGSWACWTAVVVAVSVVTVSVPAAWTFAAVRRLAAVWWWITPVRWLAATSDK